MHTQKVKIPLFRRREDISIQKRFLIAYIIIYQRTWGAVTSLSNKYSVSRQFIYNTVELFSEHIDNCFSTESVNNAPESSLTYILAYRMEGKSSITDISVLLRRFGLKNSSVGYISETLSRIGNFLGNKLDMPEIECFTFALCCDEIFAGNKPILITVDPKSLMILNIELADKRDLETWSLHFQYIKEQGINISLLAKDEGVGLKAAQKVELPEVPVQSDTFHAVAHRFGLFANRFLTKAYKLISEEYKCARLFANAKSEQNCQKRYDNYWLTVDKTNKAIELYENFSFLYHCLLECFEPFDNDGTLKDTNKVTEDFDLALELLEQLEVREVNKEIKSINNCKGDLFTFLHSATDTYGRLSQSIDIEILKRLCLAWQCKKNGIKAKKSNRNKFFRNKEQRLLNYAKELCGDDYELIHKTAYEQLNNIIQSSAAVECINSLLRPYLNTMKGKVTQGFLNLFMYYHNNHKFNSGLRKGKSPIEIATNCQIQENWLDSVLKKVT